jgi:signal transduction histidine kinase
MSLRRAYLVFSAVLAFIAVTLAVALMILTTALHRGAHEIRSGAEGLRIGEELESALVTLRDAPDEPARRTAAGFLRRELMNANSYVGDDSESDILSDARTKIEGYIQAPTRENFDRAFAATRDWTRVNFEQSRAVKVIESRWDRVADTVALVAVGVIVIGIGGLSLWLRRRTFVPAMQLANVIDRYAGGERSARAAEHGATELRTIAHQFNDMASTLEGQRADQLTFLAGVAHDLRNPLAALKLGVAMIPPDKPLPPEPRLRQLFTRIARQIDRLDRMVYDLLDASRIESGHLSLVVESCDLRDTIRATTDLFEPMLMTHKLDVSVPDMPVMARCDCTRIEQVLANLLTNAVKYSPSGGRVRVQLTPLADGAEISVTDEGVGMTSEDIKNVFEPFRRGATTANPPPGLGLGLFVARRIVRAHGGEITVDSTPGAGATFIVRLPKIAGGL